MTFLIRIKVEVSPGRSGVDTHRDTDTLSQNEVRTLKITFFYQMCNKKFYLAFREAVMSFTFFGPVAIGIKYS